VNALQVAHARRLQDHAILIAVIGFAALIGCFNANQTPRTERSFESGETIRRIRV
jgi:hypothetical protein